MGVQFIGAITITSWAAFLSFIFFYTIKLQGRLRISVINEIVGTNIIERDAYGQRINFDKFKAVEGRLFAQKVEI